MASDTGALPSRFGRYEILGLIGSGSFADVVRAWDDGLSSHVAIKILNPQASADDLARDRFIEEGKLLRRVHSPCVLAVHDLGELDDGRPYLVVDFADGGTLEDRIDPLEGQPIDGDTIRRIAESLAAGLGAMHEAGIVHRDIKPENLMIDTPDHPKRDPVHTDTILSGGVFDVGERLLIGDLGLAKDLANRGSAPSVIGGSARYQAPEQLRVDGVLGPATDLYAASSVLWRLLTGQMAPEPHDVSDSLTIFRPGWQTYFARAMAMDSGDRFASADAWLAATLDQLELEPVALAEGDRVPVASRACPYKGLASFQPEDAQVFFGREDLVEELLRRLQTNRVLVVAGPSGSGKSSVVRAGLVPALRNGALAGSETWHYEMFTPGTDPLGELHYRLTRQLDGAPRISAAELAAEPRQARRLLDDASESGPGWLLHVDQFEEIFTHPEHATTASSFVDALSAMTDPIDSRLRLVIGVRADFYGRCAQLPWLARRITDNQVLVGPLSAENMRRTIEEPARRHGLRFEPGLVDAVLDEGGRSAGSLPLISHALVETWARRQGNLLTTSGFREAGGVGGAIAKSADALFDTSFDAARQRAAKRLMLRLITPGEGTADTRRRLPFEELERDAEPEVMADVVDQFVSARLLAVDDKTVEIAHEALIAGWPRLRDWIDGERENLRFRHRIGRAAVEWDGAGRDPDLLWRGAPLATAVEWAADHGDGLDRLEQEFIDNAEAARVEAETIRARRAARSQRNRRRATLALTALTMASVAASVVAFVAFRRASDSTSGAERQFANALGTSALGQAVSDPRQALLLAAESEARSEVSTVDARAALIQARLAMSAPGVVPRGPAVSTPGSFKVALRPDGAIAAVADPTGPIRLYDTATGDQLGNDLLGHDRGARTLTFTADGTRLVSGGSDHIVYRWDTADPTDVPPPLALSTTDFIAWSVDVSPDDRQVAVGNDDGTIRVLDIEDGALLQTIEWDDGTGGITVAAYSPDGSKLVASNRSGRVNGWATDGYEQLWDPNTTPDGAKIWEIVFSPDGSTFATAGDGPMAHIHDADTGVPIDGLVFGEPSQPGRATATTIRGVAFIEDGARLVGGSASGAVHTWRVDDPVGDQTTTTARHTDNVEHGDLSADGTIYATVGDDKRLRIWQTVPVPVFETVDGFEGGAYGAAFDPSGQRLAIGSGDGKLHLLSLDGSGPVAGSVRTSSQGHEGLLWDVVWGPDGDWVASIGDDGTVLLWDPDELTVAAELGQHQAPGRTLARSPDGRLLLSADRGDRAGQGADVFIWTVATTSLHHQLPPHDLGVRAATFSPDGELLATADGAGQIRIWDTEDFSLQREWSTGQTVWALSFNEENMLASADATEDVRVFDAATGDQVGVTVSGLTDGGAGVGFTADGQTAAVVARDGELLIIDWRQGVNLAATAISAHPGSESFELHFDPTGSRFVTTGTDGTVRVWDILATDRACAEAADRLDPSIEADLFDGATPVACAQP